MDEAMGQIEEVFSSTKLADLIDESSPTRPLCGEIISAKEANPLAAARMPNAKPV
jgi:hypothetical protein